MTLSDSLINEFLKDVLQVKTNTKVVACKVGKKAKKVINMKLILKFINLQQLFLVGFLKIRKTIHYKIAYYICQGSSKQNKGAFFKGRG